ncbi:HK97 family phage prohead protease [Paenibacillus sp. ACRRX]|uniref:HK97 family phage prohead protease n=1 Tax=Paenibacillus sp. ACRRX TaxID=2918206 RepID=UPI001EF70336|nr:HK97 family phage prohead protease [Paenibacillus sp. ACRRX]MCG7410583.1 HK97 family phage prohead protease [Paenibacillus sp. ACRRX]
METTVKKSPLAAQEKRKVNFESKGTGFRAVSDEVDGKVIRRLRGYPILFDVPGKPWVSSQWIEKVDKKALEGVDFSRLVILLDHNTTWVLGRVGKNMRAEIDDVGLFVEVTLGDTWIDDYAFDRVEREIIDGMSFWFDNNAVIATDWENKIDVILKINQVFEVSLVTFPAYDETVIVAENVEEQIEAIDDDEKEALANLMSQL